MGLTEKTPVVSIYPNPSNGHFIIESLVAGTYEVLDVQGRKIMKGTLDLGANEVNLNANGLFLICISSLEGQTTVRKLHVE
jgi:hypothetical protein